MNIAIVTGASSGMGREFVLQLSKYVKVDEIWVIARRLAALVYLRTGSRISPEAAAAPAGGSLTEQLRDCCQAALDAAAVYAVQPLYPELFRELAAEQQRSGLQLLGLLERRLYGP